MKFENRGCIQYRPIVVVTSYKVENKQKYIIIMSNRFMIMINMMQYNVIIVVTIKRYEC